MKPKYLRKTKAQLNLNILRMKNNKDTVKAPK